MIYKTVNDLLELCKQEVENGNGDRKILLSNDDEGNGYHALYYDFTPAEEIFVDEDGEEKSTKYVVGLFATSVEEATNMMKEYMRQGIQDMRLVSVKRTKIADLL